MDQYTTTLIQAAERITPAPGLVTQLLIGDKVEFLDGLRVDQDFYISTKKLAPVVARQIGGKAVSHTPWNSYDFETPNLAPRFPMDDDFLLDRFPGEPIVGGWSVQERQDAWIGKRLAEAKAMVTRRVEWMGATLLSTGTLTIQGDGYQDVIDLGHTNSETLGAAVQWTAAGGDPLADLSRWRLECLNESGVAPNICVMGTTAAAAFLNSAAVQAQLDVRNYNLGRIEPRALPEGAIYLGYLAALDIECYAHGAQYETDAGAMTAYIAADRIALFPSADRNSARLVYGIVRDAKKGEWVKSDLYPRRVVDEDANTEYLECISRPLVVFTEIDSFYWADVA